MALVVPFSVGYLGWPQVGFEGGLFLSGLAILGGAIAALVGVITSALDARARPQGERSFALVVVSSALLSGYALLFVLG